MVPEQRTKTVNYTVCKPVTETKTQEYTVNVPYTEQVEQTYTVNVPYTEEKTQTYTVNVPYTEDVEQSYTVNVPYTERWSKPTPFRFLIRSERHCNSHGDRAVPVTTMKTVTVNGGSWVTETMEVPAGGGGALAAVVQRLRWRMWQCLW